ncbi:LolA family protein [Streptomyces violens]|uniref:LolA family protein n=1 Tax=Streptomyces violens TaxID=66377 RepID=UPI0004BF69FE|nr:outer membrane lipoprotein carrier protein LolA [Streptomyces violens]
MPRNEASRVTGEWDDGERRPGRRKAIRYGVPVAVAGVAAATIGLVPAFAGSGDPDLPEISAQDLIAKVAASDVQQLSGTVRTSTDLGLPELPGGMGAGALGSGQDKGGADPKDKLMELASGSHTLRVAADGPDRQRVSVIDKAAEYSLVRDGDKVWGYDSGSNTAFRATGPESDTAKKGDLPKGVGDVTPQELAEHVLDAAGDTTSVTVDGTAKIAGRDAYQLLVKPKQAGSTVGSVRIAVDADNGVPLRFTLTPKSGGAPALEAGFTSVDFAKPAAGTFAFDPPKGAKIIDGDRVSTQRHDDAAGTEAGDLPKGLPGGLPHGLDEARGGDDGGMDVIGHGWTAIAKIEGAGAAPGKAGQAGQDKEGATGQRAGVPAGDAAKFLDSMGEKVTGSFGSGHVFSTRLVNALMTDDGTVYVGAVDRQSLVKAANAEK